MKSFFIYSFVVFCFFGILLNPSKLESAGLTTVQDTLQSSRLSVNARVDVAGTLVGGSNVRIKSVASAPANTISTANLREGDSVTVGTGTYTVVGITDATNFTVTPVILAGDETDLGPVYLAMKPRQVITFSTVTAVPNGFFQVLIPADNTVSWNDGKPDAAGFDFNTTVTATAAAAGLYNFVTGVATVSGGTGCTSPANYHCVEFHYSGAGSIGQAIVLNIGTTAGTGTPIAPSTGGTHTEGTADTYAVLVKNFANQANPNTDTPIDKTTGRVALIEGVRVTATVEPTIALAIGGIASGQTRCGVSTDVTTTALAVPFGSLILNTFRNAAQDITVSTNATSGYAVTVSENQPLGKDGGASPFIIDALGNNSLMTEAVSDEWTANTTKWGFAYSLQNVNAAAIPFEYNTATGNCTGTFCARQIANIAGLESAAPIFSSTTVANAEHAYVCYRINVGASQAAGDYENQITYTATGKF